MMKLSEFKEGIMEYIKNTPIDVLQKELNNAAAEVNTEIYCFTFDFEPDFDDKSISSFPVGQAACLKGAA